jgi:hypothetical protein
VPEIRSDFSRSKEKQQQRKATAMMMLEGAFKMFVVGVAVLRSQAMAQAEGQVRSRPPGWYSLFLVVCCV